MYQVMYLAYAREKSNKNKLYSHIMKASDHRRDLDVDDMIILI
jgi:hypothetical protein